MTSSDRSLAIIFKLILGILAAAGLTVIIFSFGPSAWRVFPAWVLAIASLYYIVMAFKLILGRQAAHRHALGPVLGGMVLISLLLSSAMTAVAHFSGTSHPTLNDISSALIYGVLPFLALGDWLFFTPKGRWRPIDPWYWLALPLTYFATMTFTAIVMPKSMEWRYPFAFLNYPENGLDQLWGWTLIISMAVLMDGYWLLLADGLISGKIGQQILLPKVKSVEVETSVKSTPKSKNNATASSEKSKKGGSNASSRRRQSVHRSPNRRQSAKTSGKSPAQSDRPSES